jgi:hypothetical protein
VLAKEAANKPTPIALHCPSTAGKLCTQMLHFARPPAVAVVMSITNCAKSCPAIQESQSMLHEADCHGCAPSSRARSMDVDEAPSALRLAGAGCNGWTGHGAGCDAAAGGAAAAAAAAAGGSGRSAAT